MNAPYLLGAYLGAGAVAWVVVWKKTGRRQGVALIVLWPFLLPARIASGSDGRVAALVDSIQGQMSLLGRGDARERRLIGDFGTRVEQTRQRLLELDGVLPTAPFHARDRLARLRDRLSHELDDGLKGLEELQAHLTVLRLAGDRAAKGEGIDELLARLDALTELHASDSAGSRGEAAR
jgi:hypothetical protein